MKNHTITNRITVIDALRGFALLGIIVNHSTQEFLAGPTPPSHPTFNIFSPTDAFVGQLMGYLTLGKFFTIFSFLFGLSFAIQMDSATKDGCPFAGRMLWRILILFVIGFIHSMFYSGDVLRIYAFLGIFLLLMRNLNNRVILILGLLLVLNTPLIIVRIQSQFAPPPTAKQIEMGKKQGEGFVKMANEQFSIKQNGTLADVVKMNFKGGLLGTLGFQLFTGRLFITLGLFLLGLWAGRRQVFIENLANKHIFQQLRIWSGVIALISTLIVIFLGGIVMGPPTSGWRGAISSTAFDIHQITLSVFYVSVVTLIYWKTKPALLQSLVAVGRMGLTTYLCGTVFGAITFFCYGFGLIGHIGVTISVVLAIIFFVLQIHFSNWWLSKYQFGPIEWLWRSLTFMKIQAWKQNKSSKLSW
jgi:uncharacterized protein